MSTYVFNYDTQLYYETTAVVDNEGNTTLQVAQSGVPVPPSYSPIAGQPLCDPAYYMVLYGLTEMDYTQFLYNSLAVSDQIERYCRTYWRSTSTTIPDGIQYICAQATHDQLDLIAGTVNPIYKSMAVRNYSYTLNDQLQPGSIITCYRSALDPYKTYSFGFYALSSQCYF